MAAEQSINPGLFEFSAMAIPQFAQVEMTAAPLKLTHSLGDICRFRRGDVGRSDRRLLVGQELQISSTDAFYDAYVVSSGGSVVSGGGDKTHLAQNLPNNALNI